VSQASLSDFGAGVAGGRAEFLGELARGVASAHGLPGGAVDVQYRRYTTLKSTARIARDGRLVVCLSEDVEGAPATARAAIAHVLAARVLNGRPPGWADEAYDAWLKDPTTRALAMDVRAKRATRKTKGAQGRNHDLAPLLAEVAGEQFSGTLAPPPVAWTHGAGRSVLASFDEAHRIITVSRLLDHARVKPHTLRYLLYHEMLHYEDFLREEAAGRAPAGVRRASRRRSVHPRSFVERLHRFPGWRDAEADLAKACRRRGAVD